MSLLSTFPHNEMLKVILRVCFVVGSAQLGACVQFRGKNVSFSAYANSSTEDPVGGPLSVPPTVFKSSNGTYKIRVMHIETASDNARIDKLKEILRGSRVNIELSQGLGGLGDIGHSDAERLLHAGNMLFGNYTWWRREDINDVLWGLDPSTSDLRLISDKNVLISWGWFISWVDAHFAQLPGFIFAESDLFQETSILDDMRECGPATQADMVNGLLDAFEKIPEFLDSQGVSWDLMQFDKPAEELIKDTCKTWLRLPNGLQVVKLDETCSHPKPGFHFGAWSRTWVKNMREMFFKETGHLDYNMVDAWASQLCTRGVIQCFAVFAPTICNTLPKKERDHLYLPTPIKDPTNNKTARLFCWMLLTRGEGETMILRWQALARSGIFACDGFQIFSNSQSGFDFQGVGQSRDTNLSLIDTEITTADLISQRSKSIQDHPWFVEVFGSLNAPNGWSLGNSLNWQVFHKAWQQLLIDRVFEKYDWVVKVDVDAVFFPEKLRQVLPTMCKEEPCESLHVVNAKDAVYNVTSLHGPIEVFSRAAIQGLRAQWDACEQDIWGFEKYQNPHWTELLLAEDFRIDFCLHEFGSTRVYYERMLYEQFGVSKLDPKECARDYIAFHPLKFEWSFKYCFNANKLGKDIRFGSEMVAVRPNLLRSNARLLCWTLIYPSDDVSLLEKQLSVRGGIFSCDGFQIFGDSSFHLNHNESIDNWSVQNHPWFVKLFGKLSSPSSPSGQLFNHYVFSKAWYAVVKNKIYEQYDWIVKVDLITILDPWRLRQVLFPICDDVPCESLYVTNRKNLTSGETSMDGAVEVFSTAAITAFGANWDFCFNDLWARDSTANMATEDYHMDTCLSNIGVKRAYHDKILARADANSTTCSAMHVASYPVRSHLKWLNCWSAILQSRNLTNSSMSSVSAAIQQRKNLSRLYAAISSVPKP